MKIYTKTGDTGETGLFGGQRVNKSSSYVEAYGSADELNAWLGFLAEESKKAHLYEAVIQIQHDLHSLCADLATPFDKKTKIVRFSAEASKRLEAWIDEAQDKLPGLKNFILPGGSYLSSKFHIARTVCRRAEREVVRLSQEVKINLEVLKYLNRLSDLLFVYARLANKELGVADIDWDQSR